MALSQVRTENVLTTFYAMRSASSLRGDVLRRPRRVEVGSGVEPREERLPRRVGDGLRQELQPRRE